ncbi:MAG: sugar phosphate isomerase/epimerase [Phycisphaerae bacterium]|nr:sugar phosphate isomerase/epimerase [Phycisphaerae bacterium]
MGLEFSITTDLAGQKRLIGPLFAAFNAAGFRVVHWCQDWSGEPVLYSADFAEQVRQLAAHFSLRVADIHGYGSTPEGVTYTDSIFAAMNINRAEFAARVGATTVVLHVPGKKTENFDEAVTLSLARLRLIQPAFVALGIKAAVENLARETDINAFYDTLFGEFGPEFLGFCYDSGHAVLSNQQYLLAKYIDRLLVTHLHDNDGTKDQHRMPGEGKADWPMIVRTLKGSSYRGTVNLEISHATSTLPLEAYCRQGHETLTRLWNS